MKVHPRHENIARAALTAQSPPAEGMPWQARPPPTHRTQHSRSLNLVQTPALRGGVGGGEGSSERIGSSCADNGGIPTGGTRTLTTRRSWPTTASVNLVRLDTPGMIMKKRECVADEIQTRAQTYANQVRCLSEGTTAPLELFQPRSPAREHVGSNHCARDNETHRGLSFTMPRNVADHHY